jgi:hypothetical protein
MAKKKSSGKRSSKKKRVSAKASAARKSAARASKPAVRKSAKRAKPAAAKRTKSAAKPRAAQMVAADLDAVFSELKSMLTDYASALRVQVDKAGTYYLNTLRDDMSGKPQFFGGARKGKNYVSLYLMPVYEFADLMSGVPAELRTRMQGKSCFNFETLSQIPREELKRLMDAAVERVRAVAPTAVPAAVS